MSEHKLFMYHIDLKRPQWTPSYLYNTVKLLKAWGFNSILYEMEDKFIFKNHPSLADIEAPPRISTANFVNICKSFGIEVIPMMQSLGHAECVVGKTEFAHLRENPDCLDQYNPLSTEARAHIISMYDEIIDVFKPREYFHIGGDETFSLGTSQKCREVVKEIGLGGLYLQHILPILEHIHQRGLKPIIWSDMISSYPEIISKIPKYAIMMDWDYGIKAERSPELHIHGGGPLDPITGHRATIWGKTWQEYQKYENPAFQSHLERFAVDEQTYQDGTFKQFYAADALLSAGLEVLTASASRSCGDMMGIPHHQDHLANCFVSARKGLKEGKGNLVTSWAVRHNHPELGHPATFAAVYAKTNRRAYNEREIYEAFTLEYYGVNLPDFIEAATKAQKGFRFAERRGIEEAFQKLQQKEDPVPSLIENLVVQFKGIENARTYFANTIADYQSAYSIIEDMKSKVLKNTRNLDFWLEGIALQQFYAEFILKALQGNLAMNSLQLLNRLNHLRENTIQLFSETYMPNGLMKEVELRYGFFVKYLNSNFINPKPTSINLQSSELPLPVAHWPFHGNTDNIANKNWKGVAKKINFVGGPDGLLKGAALFDGYESQIDVPDHEALHFGEGDFSIATWVKAQAPISNTFGDILSKFDPAMRNGINFHIAGSSPGYCSMSDSRHVHFGIDDGFVGEWQDHGKPWASNALVSNVIVFEGNLYAGIADASKPADAAHVFRFVEGQTWEDCGRLGEDHGHLSVQSMVVHEGKLYAGTGIWDWSKCYDGKASPTHVFVYDGGKSWRDLGQVGNGTRVMCLASFKGEIYAGLDRNGGGKCFKYDGQQWHDLGAPDGRNFECLLPMGGRLYAATHGNVYLYEGVERWKSIGNELFGEDQIHALTVFNGKLHAGCWPAGYVLRYEGDMNWVITGQLGITGGKNNEVMDLVTYNGKMYAGVIPRAEVYRYESDGNWTLMKSLVSKSAMAEGVRGWCRITSFASFRGKLFASTGSCFGATQDVDPDGTLGRVCSMQAGQVVSHESDIGGEWTHIAAIRQGKQIRLFVNGKLSATAEAFNNRVTNVNNTKPLSIGFGAQNYFTGAISDLRIYNSALNIDQIKHLYWLRGG